MNNSIYMGAMMPVILSAAQGGSSGCEVGWFGFLFFILIDIGMIILVSWLTWDTRELGGIFVYSGLFIDLIFIVVLIGMILGLR